MSQLIPAPQENTCESGQEDSNDEKGPSPSNMEVEEISYDHDDLSPSFADLPMEIILNIFRYLNFGDIRSASLTCRRWCEASQDSEFQSKVLLKFSKIYLADNSLPGTLFLNSFRSFPNIYLVETILGSVENIFNHIGSTVEHIIIESVDITEKQFNAILKETPNLKALTIADCFSLFMTGQFFESEADREALAESLRNVRNISLGMNQYLSDAILLRLTSLTPNLECLDLHGCHIAYHTAIQRRFYPPDRADYPSESILTFKFLLNVIENHVTTLKELNLSNTLVGGCALSLLANIKGLDLRRIDFISCRQLNFTGLDTLLKSQKNLVELNLSQSNSVSDRCMEVICDHLNNLEVLKIRYCCKISDASIIGVSKLKKLKVLDISHCDLITSDGVQQGVAKAKNDSLFELYLSRIDLCEACLIQCAENLPNLRVFDISYCVNGVTDKAVQAIIKNLIWLRFLSLDGCGLLIPAPQENTCESGQEDSNDEKGPSPSNMEVEEISYDHDDLSPSFADLPMEIILNIFRYLNFGDIRSASLTCRRWCEASQDSEFQSKVLLKFSKIYLADNSLPGTLFLNSFRSFPNIYLVETILGSVENIFNHIGSTVEHIIIESVDITEKQFNAILKETPNLKALTIADCFSLFMTGQFFESEADREALAESLRNVRNISLGMNQYLSDAILLRLTSLTPNLECLDLHGCHIAYHTAIQRRFYPPDRADYPSESILTFKFLLNVIENHVTTLKELNLSNTLVGGCALSLLANIKGLDLRRIDFISCRQLNFTGLDTLLKSQKNLVELNLSQSNSVSDRCMEVICDHLNNLEVLKIRYCCKISDASIIGVSKLKKLKVLDISHCDLITSDGVQQGVAKAKNDSLFELYLSRIDLCEACLIQCAENLPNLRVFDISYCVNGVTDKAVQAIIKNLIWLRFLSLDGCGLITDAAITGINVKAQLTNESTSFASSSIEEINGSPRLDDANSSHKRFKISLRSKAEEDIIEDAKRKKAMLAIYEMNQVDDRNQDGLSIKELKGLQTLHLQGCSKISDVSLKYGLKFLELRELILSNCQQISVIGMQALVENCPSIEVLALSECYNINDKCIEVISRCLQRLQFLDISGCNQLTDHSLDYIVINCKVLQVLAIRHCRRMCSDVELRLSCLSTLRRVHRDRTSSLDNADIFRVKNYGLRWDY